MSDAPPRSAGPFSTGAVLAAIVVGLVALCAMLVLLAYAPDLRGDSEGGGSALSKSAIGFAGLERALKAMDTPVRISRSGPPPRAGVSDSLTIITPSSAAQPSQTRPFARDARLLIVLPKWSVQPKAGRPGFVEKVAPISGADYAERMLNPFSTRNVVTRRKGASRPNVRLVGDGGEVAAPVQLASIDRLQTISGDNWQPLLVDENGAMIAARSTQIPNVAVLADPDLLNNQGLAKRENARVGLALIERGRDGRPVVLDVSLNGFKRGDASLLRMALEPPWVAATLCGVAAAIMVFLHALGRFGRPVEAEPVHGAGRRALVENTAAMVRAARKEPQMAPLYAQLVFRQVGDSGGRRHADDAQRDRWLEDLAALRGLESPAALSAQAAAVKTRDELMAVVRKLHDWKKGASSGGR